MIVADLIKDVPMGNNGSGIPAQLAATEITSVTCDSREVAPGALFIAVTGHAADGHKYIGQAFEKGAAAVIAERIPEEIAAEDAAKIILATDSRKATAAVAAAFYGHPSKDVTLVGITGTNGKTTITWILESIFQAAGLVTGVIGTVNIRYPGKTMDNPITTPDAVSLQRTLHDMKAAGVTHVIMEVSSHSLDQFRVDGCDFNTAVFTNLSQDHLDYHHTMAEYFGSKQRLFTDYLASDTPAVINVDDAYGKRLADTLETPVIRVSHTEKADITATDIRDEITGLSGTLDFNGNTQGLCSALTGRFNLENILCAAGTAFGLGLTPEAIIRGIGGLTRVPGRLEKLDTPLNRHIFVDYAHTPDALASILRTLSGRAPARLITVFGCGGDRDRTKRAPMGQFACRYSNISIVTSDNPRTEDPETIVDDIIAGIREDGVAELNPEVLEEGQTGYIRETDRAKALDLAVRISGPQDIIVAAGKGHETYQITNNGTIHFDDMEHLEAACNRLLTPMDWSIADLSQALGTTSKIPAEDEAARFTTIGTDSRTIEPDMVFLALEGENFDGHDFVPALIEKGIRAFVVKTGFLGTLDALLKNRIIKNNILVFETEDTLAALGHLAAYHKDRSDVRLVAITGSNGKTTTRKMTREIFATGFDTLATQGNFNNEIGMPQTLLKLAPVHQWAVIEMGMNHFGELSRLTAFARPDIALITNTSGAHLEGLKTADNVARAKSEIFEGLKEGGTALIFADDPRRAIMEDLARSNTAITDLRTFGSDAGADIRVEDINTSGKGLSFSLREDDRVESFLINTPALFMANNAAAAAAAARAAGISYEDIRTGLSRFTPVKGRMNLRTLSDGTHLIDDTYNANPASMGQALKTLGRMAGIGNGLAALGDMLELGPDSDQLHREMGRLAAETRPAKLYLFGTQTAHLKTGAVEAGYPEDRILHGAKEELAADMAGRLASQEWLLLKGSRGMAMETLIPLIENELHPRKSQTDGKAT
ncbi:MAG: UDP-N-acetylmuramoyl-L-alanyl-D-glutamate--2,6-diaminopimelate ligase [Desulfobacterales bacterium]|nr:UDP-N-acetylmuramoyl-L-alanyl-D-glutamate--2,6-diaminopimelate ligase [Desulfobacterales bacterium]